MRRPFEGMKVLDLTHVLAGPFCTYQLAVLGADVIKIEHPARPDQTRETGSVRELKDRQMGTAYLTQSSNKRCLTLDLQQEAGREVFRRLARGADVIVENYRTGALDGLGIGYEALAADNPGLVFCSITGYGQNGPKAQDTAYDMVIQAVSGIMSLTGTPQTTPLKVGGPVVDYSTGTMAAFAVASALFQRSQTGIGQRIDVSMLDTTLVMLSATVTDYLSGGSLPAEPRGNDWVNANGSCYPTREGLLMLGALNPRQHERLWRALGREDIAARSSYREVESANPELRAELSRLLLARTANEWEVFLNSQGVPAGRVRSLKEALDMAQVKARDTLLHTHADFPEPGMSVKVPVAAFSYAHDGPRVTAAPRRHGEDTDAVLAELGLSAAEIAALRAADIV